MLFANQDRRFKPVRLATGAKGTMSVNSDEAAMRLAELLTARVCHDLAGAVGAVAAGAELLGEDAAMDGEALRLLSTSAATAVAKLKFLRHALGGGGATQSAAALRAMAAEYLATVKAGDGLRLDWQVKSAAPWDAGHSRLVLNLILLAQDCLPKGGAVVVRDGARPQDLAEVVAEGTGAAAAEANGQLDAGSAVDASIGPRGAQGAYAGLLARQLGLRIDVAPGAGHLVLRAIKE